MSQQQSKISLDSVRGITLAYMAENEDQTFERYDYYQQLVLSFLRDQRISSKFGIESHKAVTSAAKNGVIQMPQDYVQWYAVGYIQNNAYNVIVWDKGIIPYGGEVAETNVDFLQPENQISGSQIPFFGNTSFQPMFMTPGANSSAYFNENRKEKLIIVKPALFNKEVVVQYISYGADMNGNTIVPYYYKTPAHTYIDYFVAKKRKQSDWPQLLRLHQMALEQMAINMSDRTKHSMADLFNSMATNSIKIDS